MRFRTSLAITAVLSTLLLAGPARAQPVRGFHEGPYLALEFGIMQADNDTDQQSGNKIGFDVEPAFGFLFGWNLFDAFAAELKTAYATNFNGGQRTHLINGNLFARYTFLIPSLLDFPSLRILPFLKVGPSVRMQVLPGNSLSSDQSVSRTAFGGAVGGGVSFLWKKYLSFGIDLQGDFLSFNDLRQNLDQATPALNDQLIYRGGFEPTLSGALMLGVHY